jgi:predicted dinucleotide-binding enzyme
VKIGVFGTGTVGKALGGKLLAVGHEVMLGSRSADNPEANAWAAEAGATVGTFADAARFGELLLVATAGAAVLDALGSCDAGDINGKVVVDVTNPLDFSAGFPPSLSIVNTDSQAEQVQAAYPEAKVVKTFNTISAVVMVDPASVPGHHTIFHSGNDAEAKATVAALQQSFGWPAEDIMDLGDITTARGAEMYLPLWLRMFGVVGTPFFNINVVRG